MSRFGRTVCLIGGGLEILLGSVFIAIVSIGLYRHPDSFSWEWTDVTLMGAASILLGAVTIYMARKY